MEMVRKLITPDTTVLWSTAYLDEAHSFDTAVVLDKGKVIYNGKPDDLARDTKEFEEKVIDLMGGYKKEPSKVAQNYLVPDSELSCTVEADNLEKKYGNFYAVKNNSFSANSKRLQFPDLAILLDYPLQSEQDYHLRHHLSLILS